MTKKQFEGLQDGQTVILKDMYGRRPHVFSKKNLLPFGYNYGGLVYHETNFDFPTEADYQEAVKHEEEVHAKRISDLKRMFGK